LYCLHEYLEMLVYLDNCCFNRPFDDQSSIRVKLETDAKLYVQLLIRAGKVKLAWSYILDYENDANPFFERKYTIEKWKYLSAANIEENDVILYKAKSLAEKGLKPKDALHVACAIDAGCKYFLTTDDQIQRKMQGIDEIKVFNPVEFIKIIEKL
ncbi:MAG TPA: PIN domain-containing protein, partial [Candidatus Babeliaceae bacterium]|nr:PIN domain-containing protein [Candidatus Babeliaceae bacterium]